MYYSRPMTSRPPILEGRPSSLEDVCPVIGYRATRILVAWFAGKQLYVPENFRPKHPLAVLLGDSAARALIEAFPRSLISIPSRTQDEVYARHRTIAEQLARGVSVVDVAEQCDLTVRRVQQIRLELVRQRWLEFAAGYQGSESGRSRGRFKSVTPTHLMEEILRTSEVSDEPPPPEFQPLPTPTALQGEPQAPRFSLRTRG